MSARTGSRERLTNRRVAITGIGVVAPGSPGREAFWSLITSGRSGIRRLSRFDPSPFRSQIAGECDVDEESTGFPTDTVPGEVDPVDRSIRIAMAATDEALQDAAGNNGMPVGESDRLGISYGSAVGGSLRMVELFDHFTDEGDQWLCPFGPKDESLFEGLLPSTLGVHLAQRYDATGPVSVVSAGCTSGLDAVGQGAEMIQRGEAQVVIAGGTDAPLSPITVACFDAIKATSPSNESPHAASRPFDVKRNGFVLAEGAATLILEDLEHSRARGARVYAEVTGFARTANGYHMTGLSSEGTELATAITKALERAGISPEGIDYVNAHGSSTPQNDIHETQALKKALGDHAHHVPISSIKSSIGHSLGAVGAIEIAACALAISENLVPPTINYTYPDERCDLNYVPNAPLQRDVDGALSTASGFGGFQSAIVIEDSSRRGAAA
ncbi:beta-ketoacyl-[acyl-carrier-protein] synthase family protein [Brachybacterium squillarum]|uniref:beta-ketoacyl-[acyl-carrier-protein] synthase family protein n=1 Tax=Brachybacterium squillarum TaxID=661979 RepID=UPI00067FF955|nr:beta-ketoacyl-[acyl-carrier-protein] synthase family protein [Brachybacterium squillarum]